MDVASDGRSRGSRRGAERRRGCRFPFLPRVDFKSVHFIVNILYTRAASNDNYLFSPAEDRWNADGLRYMKYIPSDEIGVESFRDKIAAGAVQSALSYGILKHTYVSTSNGNVASLPFNRATVVEWLACSPPTKANRVQSPAGSPDFRKWESCRTMPLVGQVFSGISRFPCSFIPAPLRTHFKHPRRFSNLARDGTVVRFCTRNRVDLGFESRSKHRDSGFAWFPGNTPGEYGDYFILQAMGDSFPLPASMSNLPTNLSIGFSRIPEARLYPTRLAKNKFFKHFLRQIVPFLNCVRTEVKLKGEALLRSRLVQTPPTPIYARSLRQTHYPCLHAKLAPPLKSPSSVRCDTRLMALPLRSWKRLLNGMSSYLYLVLNGSNHGRRKQAWTLAGTVDALIDLFSSRTHPQSTATEVVLFDMASIGREIAIPVAGECVVLLCAVEVQEAGDLTLVSPRQGVEAGNVGEVGDGQLLVAGVALLGHVDPAVRGQAAAVLLQQVAEFARDTQLLRGPPQAEHHVVAALWRPAHEPATRTYTSLLLKPVHDIVSTFKFNLIKISLRLPTYIITGALISLDRRVWVRDIAALFARFSQLPLSSFLMALLLILRPVILPHPTGKFSGQGEDIVLKQLGRCFHCSLVRTAPQRKEGGVQILSPQGVVFPHEQSQLI
ncbi:hypothetical protein PR048_027439 [Dryococelus australis]|uniref:Uncharacterized protein n=1 Tax=Dryococelus australis TaxID=614101 RepID=A0ABQ9GFH1_9NEOP|nr:hypothetical protein PR048_027439 [Dryococelus australis]